MTPATDVYAIGATLFYLLSGHSYHAGEGVADRIRFVQSGVGDPKTACANLPGSLKTTVAQALAHTPAARFQTLDQLEAALVSFLNGKSVDALVTRLIARTGERIRYLVEKNGTP